MTFRESRAMLSGSDDHAPTAPGLRADLDRLVGELDGIADLLTRLEKRLDPVLNPASGSVTAVPYERVGDADVKLASLKEVSSPVRGQVQGLIRTASRIQGDVNTLIGRADL